MSQPHVWEFPPPPPLPRRSPFINQVLSENLTTPATPPSSSSNGGGGLFLQPPRPPLWTSRRRRQLTSLKTRCHRLPPHRFLGEVFSLPLRTKDPLLGDLPKKYYARNIAFVLLAPTFFSGLFPLSFTPLFIYQRFC